MASGNVGCRLKRHTHSEDVAYRKVSDAHYLFLPQSNFSCSSLVWGLGPQLPALLMLGLLHPVGLIVDDSHQ